MGFYSRKQTSRSGNLRQLAVCAAQWCKGGEASGSRSRAGARQGVRIRAGVGPEMVKLKFFKSSRMDLPVAVLSGPGIGSMELVSF